MANLIRKDGGVHPVMLPCQIVTGIGLLTSSYHPRSLTYAIRGKTLKRIDIMQLFDALYLRPNEEGGGCFVYNINTMQPNSVHQVIRYKNKPIPIPQETIDTINR